MSRIFAIVASGWLAAGCFGPQVPEGLACDLTGECPPGQGCDPISRTCRNDVLPIDASVVADAASDAGADAFSAQCSGGGSRLLGCYDFEDTLDDGSGNGLHLSGNTVVFVAGVRGQALEAQPDRNIGVRSDELDFMGPFTVEAIVIIDVAPSAPSYFLHRSGHFGISTNNLRELVCTVGDVDAVVASIGSVEIGSWFHAACSFGGTEVTGYIDGESVGSAPVTMPPGSGAEFIVGGESNGDEDLRGAVDSVRLWTVALPPAAICESADEFCAD